MVPEDFIKTLKLAENEKADFLDSLNQKPPTSIRVNPAKAKIALNAEAVPWAKNAFYLEEKPRFTSDPAFHAGAYYPQEAASMFIEKVVRELELDEKPIRVLDLCAAPGGKSTHLRSSLHPESLLVCNEVIRTRTPVLAENLLKWGYTGTVVTQNDPRDFERLRGFFDLVVVDAPCSGEGLFRKQPEAADKWSLKNVELCAARQERILENVWPALKEGGTLVYSTCTYNPKENEDNIHQFCATKPSESIPLKIEAYPGIEEINTGKILGYRFMPHRVQSEGFFISVIRKLEEEKTLNHNTQKRLFGYNDLSSSNLLSSFVSTEKNEIIGVQESHLDYLGILQDLMNVKTLGIQVGKLVREKFVSDHGLTMMHGLEIPFTELSCNLVEALTYLQKNDLRGSRSESGTIAISFKGFLLGLARAEKSRVVSKYPKNIRILKAVPEAYTKLVDSL